MIGNIEPKYNTIHIAGREYKARYSLNALLYLEDNGKPINELLGKSWTIDDILHLVRASTVDRPINRKTTIRRKWDKIKPSIKTLEAEIQPQDILSTKIEIMNAVGNSLPKPIIGQKSDGNGEIDGLKLRAVYVDLLRRPTAEFWTSTLREIIERIDAYYEAKGLKKPVEEVQMYEDE